MKYEDERGPIIEGDLYRVLGVRPDATFSDIKKAYRDLIFQLHPDKTKDLPEAERLERQGKFIKVRDAYVELSDPVTREAHDYYLRNQQMEQFFSRAKSGEFGNEFKEEFKGAGFEEGYTANELGEREANRQRIYDRLNKRAQEAEARRGGVPRDQEGKPDWSTEFLRTERMVPPRVSCVLIYKAPDSRYQTFSSIDEALDIIKSVAETGELSSTFELVDSAEEAAKITEQKQAEMFKPAYGLQKEGEPKVMIELAMSKDQASEIFKNIQIAKKAGNRSAENGLQEQINSNIHSARVVVEGAMNVTQKYAGYTESDKKGRAIAIFDRYDLQEIGTISGPMATLGSNVRPVLPIKGVPPKQGSVLSIEGVPPKQVAAEPKGFLQRMFSRSDASATSSAVSPASEKPVPASVVQAKAQAQQDQAMPPAQQDQELGFMKTAVKRVMELTDEERQDKTQKSWHQPKVDRLETYMRDPQKVEKVDQAFHDVAVDDLRRQKKLEGSKIPMEIKELKLVNQRLKMIEVTKPDIYERAKQSVGGKEVQSGAQIVPRGK